MTPDELDTESGAGDAHWFLNDEREFLVRSLEDAELEHDAGDLSDDDFAVLVARDRARLAEVDAELGAVPDVAPSVPVPVEDDVPVAVRKREWRRVGIIAACFLIVAGAVILVDHALNPRLPGQVLTGSITVSKQQLIEEQLTQALALNNGGQPVEALKLYNKVLSEDPNDPDALAASGWLEWNYGSNGHSPILVKEGRDNEEKAVKVAPTFYGGHLFLGLILLNQDKNAPGAVREFNKFLADNPPTAQVQTDAALLAVAYVEAGDPVPAQLETTPASSTTTSTTTTAPSTP